MEKTSGSRGESSIKPIFLMAGIPLAFSVAGFILSRITDRKISSLNDKVHENRSEGNSMDEKCGKESREKDPLEEQVFGLRSKIEKLQEKEWEIEGHFSRYHDLKEQEYALMELQNGLVVEKERAEFLEKELSSMEAENKRFDEMIIDYLQVLEELQSLRSDNVLLRRRVKKLLKKTRESSKLVRKKNFKIKRKEAVILINEVEMDRRENLIKGLENEVEEMQATISRLQEEKNELRNKLEMSEKSASLKAEEERTLMNDYNRLENELENIQKERSAEVKELIYLRWCNACLRHQLTRKNQQEQDKEKQDAKTNDEPEQELGTSGEIEGCIDHEQEQDANANFVPRNEPFFGFANADHKDHSKRRWLVRKFKKWVDGKHHVEKDMHQKCFGSHSVGDGAEERHFPGRKSYSSA